jgi:hypothetical protein
MLTQRKMMEMEDNGKKTVNFEAFLEKMGMDEDQLIFPVTRSGQYQLQQWLGKTFGAGYKSNKFAKAMMDHFQKHMKSRKYTD